MIDYALPKRWHYAVSSFQKNTNGAFDQAQGWPALAKNFTRQLAQNTVLA
jgi:hypothetical protein